MDCNIALIGLGPHAKRIYMRFLKNQGIKPKLIVDLQSKEQSIREYLAEKNLQSVKCFFVPDSECNNLSLSEKTTEQFTEFLEKQNITHAIISTEPKAHYAYASFLIRKGINILMDKPITAPIDVLNKASQTKKIITEYDNLCKLYKVAQTTNPNLIFSIQCQRRFQKGYLFVKNLLKETVKKYNIPISYIDIYHNDGMWNMPNEFVERENHPYKYGYGKVFHSGYHFIDLLTWILEANLGLDGKKINKCSVYSESYRPKDFVYNFNKEDYKRFFKTNKFDKLLEEKNFASFGEIDVHSIINFRHNENLITNCSLNLMQSGNSRRSWLELPKDTYKGNGRIRQERLNVMVGPLLNIQVHSYQAYEVKERELHGGNNVGDIEHYDIYIFRNTDLIGGKPFEIIHLNELENKRSDFIGYNEQAREKCLIDFINNVKNDSDILLHNQSILLTEMIYKSMLFEGKKLEFDFDLSKTNAITDLGTIKDSDFGLKEKQNISTPLYRFSSRGIVLNEKNEIAVFYKENKNEYKLPGGGIKELEMPHRAFIRECREEIGCEVEILSNLGVITEYKSKENFKQVSFIYCAKKAGPFEGLDLTNQEKDEGGKIMWLPKLEALNKMKDCLNNIKASEYDSVYRTKFMVLRDIKILEHFINKF